MALKLFVKDFLGIKSKLSAWYDKQIGKVKLVTLGRDGLPQ